MLSCRAGAKQPLGPVLAKALTVGTTSVLWHFYHTGGKGLLPALGLIGLDPVSQIQKATLEVQGLELRVSTYISFIIWSL